MLKNIAAFIPYSGNNYTSETVREFKNTGLVEKIYLIALNDLPPIDGTELIRTDNLFSSSTIKKIAEACSADYLVFLISDVPVKLGQFCIDRFADAADSTGAGMLYSDYYDMKNDARTPHPPVSYTHLDVYKRQPSV